MLKLIFKHTSFLIFCWMISGALFAQDKIERELRVEEKVVPKVAKDWLHDAFESTKRPKWYQEIFESGYSYEAKFKLNGKFYSVEFDSLGLIQDVEIEMDYKELPKEVQTALDDYLVDGSKRSNIKRIQIQHSGKPDDLEDFFDDNSVEGILTRFEIEFIGRDENGVSELFEGLFSEEGELIFKRKIVLVPSDNLVF